jgi:hypothetical protein
MRCLEKDPARRFQTVGELAAHLAPFGGPTAQTRAATINRLGPKSIPPDVMAMAPLTTTIPPNVAMPMSMSMPPPPPPDLEHPRRAPMALAVIGAIAIIIAIIVATRGSSSPVTTSVNGPDQTSGAFARALFDHRCADARDLAAMIGPSAVQRAALCVTESAQHFPVTAIGAMDASTHKDYAQVLSIAEVVLKQHPENVGLAELAVLAACNLGKADDARHYFVTVPAGQDHEVLILACGRLGVTLP